MSAPPNNSWSSTFTSVNDQGQNLFTPPLSPSNWYYAFLSKVDLDDTSQTYDLMFEVVAYEWMQNAIASSPVDIVAPFPVSPALIYHVVGLTEAEVVKTLNVSDIKWVAEASWYLLQLMPGTNSNTDLYDPNIDTLPPTTT